MHKFVFVCAIVLLTLQISYEFGTSAETTDFPDGCETTEEYNEGGVFCGSDGKTYNNVYIFGDEQAKNPFLKKVRDGAC